MATQRYSVTPHLIETILITNYAVTQSEINIAIGDKAPGVYFTELIEQGQSRKKKYGSIISCEAYNYNPTG